MARANVEPNFKDFKDTVESLMFLIIRLTVIDQGRAFQYLDTKIVRDNRTLSKDNIIRDQVKVVGGSLKLYEKVNLNFRNHQVDHIFLKENFDLFQWRMNFFAATFPLGCWYTEYENNERNDNDDDYFA